MLHSEKIPRELYWLIESLRNSSGGFNFYKTKKANTKAFKKFFSLENDATFKKQLNYN